MNISILKYVLIIGLTILSIANNAIQTNPLSFKCANYLMNTYLYLILSVAISLATVESMAFNNIILTNMTYFGIFVASLILMIIMLMTPVKHFLLKHLFFIIVISLFGSMIYPYFIKNKTLFDHTGITTIILLIILTIIANKFPNFIKDSWSSYLFIALIGLILARIIELGMLYFDKLKYNNPYGQIISYISIIVFIFFVLYDTKKVQEHAKQCVEADYINESLNLFLDALNLFTNIYRINDK